MLNIKDLLGIYQYQVEVIASYSVRQNWSEDKIYKSFEFNRAFLISCLDYFTEKEIEDYFTKKEIVDYFVDENQNEFNVDDYMFSIKIFNYSMAVYLDDPGQQFIGVFNNQVFSNGSYNTDISYFISILLEEYEKDILEEYKKIFGGKNG